MAPHKRCPGLITKAAMGQGFMCLVLMVSGLKGAAASDGPTTRTPPVAVALRSSLPDSPNYPLLPFDVTIDIRNLQPAPIHCARTLLFFTAARRMDLSEFNAFRIWSPNGRERRILDVGGATIGIGKEGEPIGPEVPPGGTDHVRQVLRVLQFQNRWGEGPVPRPLIEEVFLFATPGTYVTELESIRLGVRSNRLTIEVKEPIGRDRQAYEYLLRSKWPFFVANGEPSWEEEERQEVAAFLAKYGDTIYGPYARFYLSVCEFRPVERNLSTSGVVTNEAFLQVWNNLLTDRNFRLWPWVLKYKAEYLDFLSRPQPIGYDEVARRRILRPVVRLGHTLTDQDRRAIAAEAQATKKVFEREYPYFPD